ncbi:hypothetical protein NQ317_000942 [Molorchus minor]|uniref:Protein G12 n=1 Tax=Molorchus minor TaxID=1323400 RepID=A0ABQ9JU72_9CUCU|nr:hypothetical protein NQ317_000942 [Molorchus minor]
MRKLLLFAILVVLNYVGHTAPASESLEDELKDIMQLLPKDFIKNIASEHLKTDEGFKAAIKYMQSEEWINLIEAVKHKPEWIALKNYLKLSGLDLEVMIHYLEMFAQNTTITLDPNSPPQKKSFKSFIVDVEQNFPTVKFITAVKEKMATGTLQQLFDRLSSAESRKLLEAVIALPEVKKIMEIMMDMDVNLYDLLSLLYTLFGWGEFKHD